MIINQDILRRDTIQLLKQIEEQIDEVTKFAEERGISSTQLRDGNGNWVMPPLLLAKAQVYATLVELQVKR